ncbi:MAG: hypothetical protein LAP87_12410 [Acidobacteriia bacterium]|nr:hypothetical protein [Terriglobia bacterium]
MAVLLGVSGAADAAGDGPLDRATLRGLKGFSVVIDQLDPQLARDGLTREGLQRQIEARLQSAGVPVNKDAVEFLGLRILAVRDRKGPYSVSLAMGLYQPVILTRDRNIKTATETWAVETVIAVQPRLLSRASAGAVEQLADRFVAAFRSANPQ